MSALPTYRLARSSGQRAEPVSRRQSRPRSTSHSRDLVRVRTISKPREVIMRRFRLRMFLQTLALLLTARGLLPCQRSGDGGHAALTLDSLGRVPPPAPMWQREKSATPDRRPRLISPSVGAERTRLTSGSRGRHVIIGIVSGVAIGGVAGFVRARRDFDRCHGDDCVGEPSLQIVVYPVLFGAAGAIAGGVVGWVWPTQK